MTNIIAAAKRISRFFGEYGFNEILTSVPQTRLQEIMMNLVMKGNQSRTADFAELKQGFRTI